MATLKEKGLEFKHATYSTEVYELLAESGFAPLLFVKFNPDLEKELKDISKWKEFEALSPKPLIHYILMQYLTLPTDVAAVQAKDNIKKTLEVVLHILKGHGMVHGDLCPANILEWPSSTPEKKKRKSGQRMSMKMCWVDSLLVKLSIDGVCQLYDLLQKDYENPVYKPIIEATCKAWYNDLKFQNIEIDPRKKKSHKPHPAKQSNLAGQQHFPTPQQYPPAQQHLSTSSQFPFAPLQFLLPQQHSLLLQQHSLLLQQHSLLPQQYLT
ncbi:hypothetical protein CPB84DRAFT_1753679 [Gymnopilus junonius]|uniref:Uncharacterized protein n=1 Tax=Gymnopilus junonius TaxID=109634 RepID=A0A9P5NA18_GYMJU|nr:hypothetical protein CPB84DRAFT_1753679 [Gymnopilus junonius]